MYTSTSSNPSSPCKIRDVPMGSREVPTKKRSDLLELLSNNEIALKCTEENNYPGLEVLVKKYALDLDISSIKKKNAMQIL